MLHVFSLLPYECYPPVESTAQRVWKIYLIFMKLKSFGIWTGSLVKELSVFIEVCTFEL